MLETMREGTRNSVGALETGAGKSWQRYGMDRFGNRWVAQTESNNTQTVDPLTPGQSSDIEWSHQPGNRTGHLHLRRWTWQLDGSGCAPVQLRRREPAEAIADRIRSGDHVSLRWRRQASEEGSARGNHVVCVRRHGAVGGGVRDRCASQDRDRVPDGGPPGLDAAGKERERVGDLAA